MFRWTVGLLALMGWATAALPADTIMLQGGYELTGDILKADENTVVVDIGIEILRLPRSQIIEIIGSEPVEVAEPMEVAEPNQSSDGQADIEPNETPGLDWQLYHAATLERTTIEKNVEHFGEAVVMVTSPGGQGSGFIITDSGYLITNYHVIAGETQIKVTVFQRTATGFEQKHFKKVRIIALNPFVDLALLKIEQADQAFKYVFLGQMNPIETGQSVFAIGNPLGLTRTVSQGIVSTKNRNFQGQLYIQTTTDINPGNSGGPLFNLEGEVIGVTSMGYLFLGGLNFAIPVDVVKGFIENRDAFAYDEDNPNTGFRYLQPGGRLKKQSPPPYQVPTLDLLDSRNNPAEPITMP